MQSFEPEKPVRACLCFPHTFAELKEMALLHGWQDVSDVTKAVGCGSGCGLCRPYLARMLETGETAFAVFERTPVDQTTPLFSSQP